MAITYDLFKRAQTLATRHLDFEDARLVFERPHFETEDRRKVYGEIRTICYGMLGNGWWWSATRFVAKIATFSA